MLLFGICNWKFLGVIVLEFLKVIINKFNINFFVFLKLILNDSKIKVFIEKGNN